VASSTLILPLLYSVHQKIVFKNFYNFSLPIAVFWDDKFQKKFGSKASKTADIIMSSAQMNFLQVKSLTTRVVLNVTKSGHLKGQSWKVTDEFVYEIT
jgi:hypothetical protein